MGLEAATYINELNPAWPLSNDFIREADDHMRLIKQTVLNTFPNVTGEVTASNGELNLLVGQTFFPGPGGLDTYVQFKTGGAFSGSSELVFDGTLLTANSLAVVNAATLGNYVFNTDQVIGPAQDGYALAYNDSSGEIELSVRTAIWGGITGTLSNQIDLQAALDLKAPIASPTFTGFVRLGDAQAIELGAAQDLIVEHTGTISQIISNTGNFIIRQSLTGGSGFIQSRNGGLVDNIIWGGATPFVQLFQGGSSVAQTVAAAAGGMEVNNTLTGAGFERVLTTSDAGGGGGSPGGADTQVQYNNSGAFGGSVHVTMFNLTASFVPTLRLGDASAVLSPTLEMWAGVGGGGNINFHEGGTQRGYVRFSPSVAGFTDVMRLTSTAGPVQILGNNGVVASFDASGTDLTVGANGGVRIGSRISAAFPDAVTKGQLYMKSADDLLYYRDPLGAEYNLTGAGGGTPGGADTQFQYNNGGAFGGIAEFTYNDGNPTTADLFSLTKNAALTTGSMLNAVSNNTTHTGAVVRLAQEHASGTAIPLIIDQENGFSATGVPAIDFTDGTLISVGGTESIRFIAGGIQFRPSLNNTSRYTIEPQFGFLSPSFNKTSDTTLADVPDLVLDTESAHFYEVDIWLYWSSGQDAKVNFDMKSSGAGFSGTLRATATIFDNAGVRQEAVSYSGGVGTGLDTGDIVVDLQFNDGWVHIQGMIDMFTGGIWQLQAAQNTSVAVQTRMGIGSYMKFNSITSIV